MSFLFTILFYAASLCLRRLRFGQAWHTPVRLALGVLIALPFAGISGAAAADVTLKIGVEQTKYSLIGSMGGIVYSSLASDNPTIPGVTVRTFDSSGILYLNTSGTPTTTGTYTFNGSYYYYAYDQECGAYYEATVNYGLDYDPPAGKNCSGYYNIVSGTFTRTVEVVAATLSVSPTSLGTLTVGQAASVSLTTTGGSGTYSYALASGSSLPDGLSLSGSTVQGTPTSAQSYSFSIDVTDDYGNTATQSYSGTVTAAPTISLSTSATTTTKGSSVTFTATLSGGTSPSGSVVFKDGSTTLQTVSLSGSTASLTTSDLSVGSHSITASYSGDSANAAATSAAASLTVSRASPSVSLSASVTDPVLSNIVILTATISGGASPTGTVTFKDGATTLGSGQVSGGTTATFSTTSLTVGSHSITATYGGDGDNNNASASAITVKVAKTSPGLTLSPSTSSLTVKESLTLTATLSSGISPSGTVMFKDGTTTLGTGQLSGTTATFTTESLGVGSHTITATYDGDGDNGTATASAVTVTVTQASPALTLAASASSPTIHDSVTFTATLSGGASPSGTVTFKDGTTTLGTGQLSGTTATFTTESLGVGSHSITATYDGDGDNGTATASAVTVTVTQASPALTLAASASSPTIHDSVTFTATLSGGASPTGTVTFKDGSTTLETVQLSGMTASFTTSSLAVGSHSITATYGGDTDNASTTSSAISLTVQQSSSALALSASATSLTLNESVTFTASLSGAISPGGTVTFKDGSTTLQAVQVSGTTASFTTSSLAVGTHSITASYGGDSNNAASSSSALSVSVALPVLTLSPTASGLTSGTSGVSYSQSFTATNGTSPYSFAVSAGSLPAGLTLAAGGTLSGTPSANGSYSFTITATDANGATGSRSYSLAIGIALPVATSSSATVTANSSANSIALSLSGGTATSLTLVSAPAHGTASLSGTSISYTPVAGYSGSDSFTYTATNSSGASSAATVTLTVTAPTLTLTPASGALTAGVVGSAYASTSLSASLGTAPYSFALSSGSLPAGLALSSSGTLSGTPTAAGSASFTIRATDANGATGSASYSLTISAPAVSFSFSPAAGTLTAAMAGEDYSQTIVASGGTGTLVYSVSSGTLPSGMILNISTGTLTGPLASGSEGSYSFTIAVRDGNGSTGSAHYSLTVKPRAVTVSDKTVTVAAGETPADVYLNRGATGGPFTSADVVSVEPAIAGTATIRSGELADTSSSTPVGWYLQFTPNASYGGQARVSYRLISSLGSSNAGTVTYTLSYDATTVTSEVNGLVQDFVRTRQSLISSAIQVPGLLERRQMSMATEPVTTKLSPGDTSMVMGFSTSLAQIDAARNGGASGPPDFNLWIDGTISTFNNQDSNGSKWGSFGMLNLGGDYLVSDRLLLGLSFHYDRMTDPTDEDAELKGNGWLAGPNASLEVAKDIFWDTNLLYGGSANTVDTGVWSGDFDTSRIFADTALTGQWKLTPDTVITPKLRAVYFSERVETYTVSNSANDSASIEGFNEEQFRLSLGAEIARSFKLADGGKFSPKLGLTGGYSAMDGSGAFASATAGFSWQPDAAWNVNASLLFSVEGDGTTSIGARASAARKF